MANMEFGGPEFDFRSMAPPTPGTQTLTGTIPQPTAGAAMTPGTPGGGMSVPGFGGSQDLMRQIMMQILMPQLQRFFGGQAGWGPVAGSQTGGTPNPFPPGMEPPMRQTQPMPGAQPLPNPAQWGQGPAGMQQGMMSWLAPFIFQNLFQNMGQSMGGMSGGGGFPSSGLPQNQQPGMRYLT